jgi:phosphate transport system permease protein
MAKVRESVMRIVFLITALMSVLCVLFVCFFLFTNGLPAIAEIGPLEFLGGIKWRPESNEFGIFPMILGSLYVTTGAIVLGVPIGILTAVFIAFFCPTRIKSAVEFVTSLMAGIPSIIYGFFGITVIVPLIHDTIGVRGKGILAASVLLAIMILPTIISISQQALEAVQRSYFEGSIALGASKERSVFFVVLPAAKSGVLASVVLGIGRAIGETMAVVMVAGNQAVIPGSIFDGVRTMTTNIVLEMGYAADLHREALIGTGVVLFVFILLINMLFSILRSKERVQ